MKPIYFTTLSLGKNYTKDYTLKIVDEVLTKTPHSFALTTDCPDIIYDAYGNNPKILINTISKDNFKIRLKIGSDNSYNTDFNFNMRYVCLEPLLNIQHDFYTIWTDCDNSLEWWDEDIIQNFFSDCLKNNYDFLGPRNSYIFKDFLKDYESQNQKEYGLFWHKILNYDITDELKNKWSEATLPAEYLLVFLNSKKLYKFYLQFKWFHDYLVSKPFTYGTWAEGFEIGVSALVAEYNPYELGWNHEIMSRAIKANGHKVGHATER